MSHTNFHIEALCQTAVPANRARAFGVKVDDSIGLVRSGSFG